MHAMRHLTIPALLAAFGALGWGSNRPSVPAEGATSAYHHAPFFDVRLDCVNCSVCGLGGGSFGHTTTAGDSTSIYDSDDGGDTEDHDGAHGCATGECHAYNMACPGWGTDTGGQYPGGPPGGDDDAAAVGLHLEAIRSALTGGELGLARRLAAAGPAAIVYVRERDAVQVVGCRGEVVLHFPIS
jgi:hypothetical protein